MRFTMTKTLWFWGAILVTVLCGGCNSDKGGDHMVEDNAYELVTTADNLEIKIRLEKVEDSQFYIAYVLTNKGSKSVYKVVSKEAPHYSILVRPFGVAYGEKENGSPVAYEVPFPRTLKAKEIMILYGLERPPDNVLYEVMQDPLITELLPGKSESGTVVINLPFQTKSYYLSEKDIHECDKQINKMFNSQSAVSCRVVFAYLLPEDTRDSEEDLRLAFSKPVLLKR